MLFAGVPESDLAYEYWEARPPDPGPSKRVRFATAGRRPTGEMPIESTGEFPLSVQAFLVEKRMYLSEEMQVMLPQDAVLVSTSGLQPMDFMQDALSCALDAFNLAVGRVILKRGCVHALPSPRVRAETDDSDATFTCCCRPEIGPGPVRFSKNQVLLKLIAEAGYRLKIVKPRGVRQLTLEYLIGQKLGIFLVEFYVQNRGEGGASSNSAFHVVVVDCFRRLVLCNTVGVLPFNLHARAESAVTHAEIRKRLRVRNVCAVWVLCKVASV